MTYNISEEIRRTFANRFLKWGILLRDSVINGASTHVINKADWQIKFIQGINEEGSYLEFYGKHPEHHDLHFKIFENGDEILLEALTDGYNYNPALPGDRVVQREQFVKDNKEVYEKLKALGLHV